MKINVETTCPLCGESHAVEVNLAGLEAWQNGELIQNALPELSPTEREQLISGLCPKCQAQVFGIGEEVIFPIFCWRAYIRRGPNFYFITSRRYLSSKKLYKFFR